MIRSALRAARRRREARWRRRYGPWAIVTGDSDGIGRAMAQRLAAAGLGVVLVARRRDPLDQLAAKLATHHGVATRVLALDLALADVPAQVAAATADLDVGLLVAAAGFGTSGPFLDADLARELAMLGVNDAATLALALHIGRRLVVRGRGGLVLMGSLVGFQGVPYAAHYAATKAYVQALAEALHVEWVPLGVDVLACAPGPVHSGFAARADMRLGLALTPETVAGVTLRALGHRSTVRPGWLSVALEAALRPLPRTARVRVMGAIIAGMTRHRLPQPDPVAPRQPG